MQKKIKNLYDFDSESKKEKRIKPKKEKAENNSASKMRKNNTHKKVEKKKYDDEIIIGVTPVQPSKIKQEKTLKINKSNSNKNGKQNINKPKTKKLQKNGQASNTKKVEMQKEIYQDINFEKQLKIEQRKMKIAKIIRNILILAIIIGAIIFAMVSPIFNVKNIEVKGNNRVSKEEIISLSGIEKNENIFKYTSIALSNLIKQNAYINNVKISKTLPDTITITVTERTPTYMLEYGNGYVYINNQGYILEVSNEKLNTPIILGISTPQEELQPGNRLNKEDLIKLSTVIRIMDVATNNDIAELITTINIEDENNYILYLEDEKKTAYLGDCSNLETRMLYLVSIINREKNIEGEIFINMNLNTEDAFFRESV